MARRLALFVLLSLGSICLWPKEAPLIGIVLYDDANGAAYAQLAGVTLASKSEMRRCDGSGKITRKSYGRLPKIALKHATSIERMKNGILMLTVESTSFCVVPGSIRFDSSAEMTLSQAADQASLQGTIISGSQENAPFNMATFKPGVKLIFISAPDAELAEYLLAQRAHAIGTWRNYLAKHGTSRHAQDAKQTLADLIVDSAQTAYRSFKLSSASQVSDFALLKLAHAQSEEALTLVDGHPQAHSLLEQIHRDLSIIVANKRKNLDAYRKALQGQTPGYVLLTEAQRMLEYVLDVDPHLEVAITAKSDFDRETNAIKNSISGAETSFDAGRIDDAMRAVIPYRGFAHELAPIKALMDKAYLEYFSRGQKLSEQQKWADAASEYRKAIEIRASEEAKASLQAAENHIATIRNQEVADKALQQSATFVEQKDFIQAYLVLADLPEAERALVDNQLFSRKADFIAAAVERAQTLQELHNPIRGRADEDGMKEAHRLLQRASSITDDQTIKLKLDLLSDNISSYYLEQAKKYCAKPMGSGVGLGWYYLDAAQYYRPDLEAVHDERNRYSADYQLRSKLSIGIEFRDQTSRRESAGLADQLADAVATGLEAFNFVKVIRNPGQAGPLPPNFVFVGEVLQHRQITEPHQETLQSKYRAGTREVKNEAWVRASHDYELAKQELDSAQQELTLAQGRNKKKEITAAVEKVSSTQKKAEEARTRFDAVESTVPEDVIKPYNYTKTKFDVTATIELQFRIIDRGGDLIEPAVPFKQQKSMSYVILESVKPEDTEGIKVQDKHPDSEQILTDLEIEARDQLIKTVQEKLAAMPQKILDDARRRAASNDFDGAAEQYILYLNCTPNSDSPTRNEATKFLREHFNVALGPA